MQNLYGKYGVQLTYVKIDRENDGTVGSTSRQRFWGNRW